MKHRIKWFYIAALSSIPPVFGYPLPIESAVFLAAACIIASQRNEPQP